MSKEKPKKLEREICGRAKTNRSQAQEKAIAERIKAFDPK